MRDCLVTFTEGYHTVDVPLCLTNQDVLEFVECLPENIAHECDDSEEFRKVLAKLDYIND